MALVPAWILALLGVSSQNAIYGTAGTNILTGLTVNNYIEGGDGGDLITDLGGKDALGYWNSDAAVTVDFSGLLPVETGGDATGDTVPLNVFENIVGSAFNDWLVGNAGDNMLVGGAGNDTLDGGDGDDTFIPGAGTNTILGGDGDDIVILDMSIFDGIAPGETGDGGTIDLGEGFNVIQFAANPNIPDDLYLICDGMLCKVKTGGCTYVLPFAEPYSMDLAGTQNADYYSTNDGDDEIKGLGGNDEIHGLGGSDTLYGGDDNDLLFGGEGNDHLNGGRGVDTLTGEADNDDFIFEETQDSVAGAADIITDFTSGDVIDLLVLDANTSVAGNQAFSFIGGSAFSNVAGQLRYAGGLIEGDVNGDSVADLVIQSTSGHIFTAGDFIL